MKGPKSRIKLTGIFLLLFLILTLQPATLKVKVIVDNASVKVKAEIFGDVLVIVSSGSILDVEEKQGEWYKVRLEKEGSLISGFIHELFVEEVKIEELPEKKVEIPTEKPELPVIKPVLAVVNLTPQNVSAEGFALVILTYTLYGPLRALRTISLRKIKIMTKINSERLDGYVIK